MDNYSIKGLETLIQRSKCFQDSVAFQVALFYISLHDKQRYKELLYKECVACGAIEK